MDMLNKQEFPFIYIHLNGIEKTILKQVFLQSGSNNLFPETKIWIL